MNFFFDDVTADGSSRMNCDVYRAVYTLSSDSDKLNAAKLIRQSYKVQTQDSKHLVMSMSSRPEAVIDYKGFSNIKNSPHI